MQAGPGARDYAPEERVLSENQLANLDSYFSRWKSRNEEVLAKVPAPRLLIVRTDQITQKAFEIADFAGLRAAPSAWLALIRFKIRRNRNSSERSTARSSNEKCSTIASHS